MNIKDYHFKMRAIFGHFSYFVHEIYICFATAFNFKDVVLQMNKCRRCVEKINLKKILNLYILLKIN